MIHFEHLIEKLRALENVRNVDMTNEEFSYTYPGSNLAPIPKMYSQSVDSPETISYELNIDPAIRSKVLALKKSKKPDEAVVYNPDTKTAEIVDKSETNDYVQKGFKVIYEEANVAPVPGPAGFTNTSGSFDTVAGMDKRLGKKRNKRELDKFNGKTFDLTPDMFRRMKEGKERYSRWSQFIEEEEDGPVIDQIRSYSLRNPTSPVVIRDTESGEKAILRRKTNDSRLRHNRNKLKEETDPPEQNLSDYALFRQFLLMNMVGQIPGQNSPNMFQSIGMTEYNNSITRLGAGFPMFPMANAPQPLLDMFDYNGDGIVGYNDMSLVTRMFEIMDEMYGQYGDGPPSGLPSASWYRENWESFNQEYGVDLPDPSSWFFQRTYDGQLFFSPDSQQPVNDGTPTYGDAWGAYGGNGLYEWRGTVLDYFNLIITMDGWTSIEVDGLTNGTLPTQVIQQYFPEFYEFLMVFDYIGDGFFYFGSPISNVASTDAGKIFYYMISVLKRTYELRLGVDPYESLELVQNLLFDEVDALQGFDGMNRFIQTLILTGNDIYGIGFLREYIGTNLGYLIIQYFPYDPNYGQVPTPPEETPIAQSPYQITQLPPPTPENP